MATCITSSVTDPFSLRDLQSHFIWSLCEGQEVFSSARPTAWPSATLPIVTSDHSTLAEGWRLISKVNSNNHRRISLQSHLYHWPPPLPYHHTDSTIPNLELTSIGLPIISYIHAPATSISVFFYKASNPLISEAGGNCYLRIALKQLPRIHYTTCEVLYNSCHMTTNSLLEVWLLIPLQSNSLL